MIQFWDNACVTQEKSSYNWSKHGEKSWGSALHQCCSSLTRVCQHVSELCTKHLASHQGPHIEILYETVLKPSEQQLCSRRGVSIMLAAARPFAHSSPLHHHVWKAVSTKHHLRICASIFTFVTAGRRDEARRPICSFVCVHQLNGNNDLYSESYLSDWIAMFPQQEPSPGNTSICKNSMCFHQRE